MVEWQIANVLHMALRGRYSHSPRMYDFGGRNAMCTYVSAPTRPTNGNLHRFMEDNNKQLGMTTWRRLAGDITHWLMLSGWMIEELQKDCP
jgi:hypothetical protein